MTFRLVQELAAGGVLVAVACRVLRVSTSGYYEWRGRAPSPRAVADAALTAQIREIHASSRGTYGVPRVHAELRLGRMESQLENHKAKIKQGEDRIEFDETGFTQPKIRAILNRHIEERTKMHVTIRDLEQKIEEIYRRNPELKR